MLQYKPVRRRIIAASLGMTVLICGVAGLVTILQPTTASGTRLVPIAAKPTATLSPDKARFCLQAPYSGTIAFSNLHYVQLVPKPLPDDDMPTMQVSTGSLPENQTISVTWRERSGRQFNPIAVFSTDTHGNPTAIHVLRRAVLPASDIALNFWSGRQETGVGGGIAC